MKEIFPSSDKARATDTKRENKYPWEAMKVDDSFHVTYNEIKLESLRPLASRMGKKFNKKFKVVDHGIEKGYEVSCRSLREQIAVQSPVEISDKPFTSVDEATNIARIARETGKSIWEVKKELEGK